MESKRFVALMKAEPQNGFSVDEDGLTIALLKNLVLTPASKLYKVGFFAESSPADSNDTSADGWKAHLYDENITQSDRQKASIYFYEAFLGCGLPDDNAHRTKELYHHTDYFISNLNIAAEDKFDLKTALYTYLKTDSAATVSVDGFASSYLANDPHQMAAYKSYMTGQGVPTFGFQKDLGELGTVLKRRTVKFPSGLKISGAAASIEGVDFRTETIETEDGGQRVQTVAIFPEAALV